MGQNEEELFRQILRSRVAFPTWASVELVELVRGLLTRDPANRTGSAGIRKSQWFVPVDWDKLAAREVEPPCVPAGKGKGDVTNFDAEFTSEEVNLTPADQELLEGLDQREFFGFSFVNDAFVYK